MRLRRIYYKFVTLNLIQGLTEGTIMEEKLLSHTQIFTQILNQVQNDGALG